MSDWEPTRQKLAAIHSISRTGAGEALCEYIESEADKYRHYLINGCDATDASSIAYSQAAIRIGEGLLWLLKADMDELLKQHNFPPEDEDYENER